MFLQMLGANIVAWMLRPVLRLILWVLAFTALAVAPAALWARYVDPEPSAAVVLTLMGSTVILGAAVAAALQRRHRGRRA